VAKLTVKQLEAITADRHGETVRDEGGLLGKVAARTTGVAVSFYYRFRWDGKSRDFGCGTWPKKTLSEIRQERDRARQQVGDGINPIDAKKAMKIEAQAEIESILAEHKRKETEDLTIADLYTDWIRDGVARQDGNAALMRSFEKDVLPRIGKKLVRELADKDILDLLRKVRARGLNRTVVMLNNDIGQMLRWAEKRKPWRGLMIDGNPVDLVDVDKLLDPDYEEERSRTLSADEIRELRDIFMQLETDYDSLPAGQKYSGIRPVNSRVQRALWLCLGTMCRIGELLQAEWKDIDLANGTWFIPASKTKGKRGKRQDHHVFLSPFAVAQLQLLHAETGSTPFCFPGKRGNSHVCTKTVSKLVGDRQYRFKSRTKPLQGRHNNDSLVLAGGANGEWTPHDLRRTGATMMQGLGIPLDIIDRCQNHVMKGKVRRHYLHHDYAHEKAEAWAKLGQRIEIILNQENVLIFPKKPNHK
tara:strand:+ start:25583 stop:27001 length:1419 start_codon:yes stop_codon:yes gene_type:complete